MEHPCLAESADLALRCGMEFVDHANRRAAPTAKHKDVRAVIRVARIILTSLPLALFGAAALAQSPGPFIDLSDQVPGSDNICDAVKSLRKQGHEAAIADHALPETKPVMVDPQKVLSSIAWEEANVSDSPLQNYIGPRAKTTFWMSRVELLPSVTPAWVLSTTVSSLHSPLMWVFTSTPDGSAPEYLMGPLGSDDAGPVTIFFVRFQSQPYAIIQSRSKEGISDDLVRMSPFVPSCSFGPR
jgi:hypothetical protein